MFYDLSIPFPFYLDTSPDNVLNSFSLSHYLRLPCVMKKKGQKQKVEKKEPVEKDLKTSTDASTAVEDEEVNSGFGSYLRSSTGKSLSIPLMKLSGRFQVFSYFRPRDVETVRGCELACDVLDDCLAANTNRLQRNHRVHERKTRFR